MDEQIILKQVDYASSDYEKMVGLRNAVLRIPFGRLLKPEELERDKAFTHFAAFNAQSEVVGTVLLSEHSPQEMRARQVAVRADMQGKGIGARLLAHVEEEARRRNYPQMILYARNAAIPFYERIGYTAEGDFFEEVGIPHIMMRKIF